MASLLHWLTTAAQRPAADSIPSLTCLRAALPSCLLLVLLTACATSLTACDDKAGANTAAVKIGGKTFFLELALDDQTRFKGLGGRTHIDDDGGMLFVFTYAQPHSFVMHDCPIPIDILFLDGGGRIVAAHAMVPEPPRKPEQSDLDYERSLKLYPSRFASQLVVELQGGMIQKLGVKEGDLVHLDAEGLKKRAR